MVSVLFSKPMTEHVSCQSFVNTRSMSSLFSKIQLSCAYTTAQSVEYGWKGFILKAAGSYFFLQSVQQPTPPMRDRQRVDLATEEYHYGSHMWEHEGLANVALFSKTTGGTFVIKDEKKVEKWLQKIINPEKESLHYHYDPGRHVEYDSGNLSFQGHEIKIKTLDDVFRDMQNPPYIFGITNTFTKVFVEFCKDIELTNFMLKERVTLLKAWHWQLLALQLNINKSLSLDRVEVSHPEEVDCAQFVELLENFINF